MSARRAPDLQVTEVRPVDLPLFPSQGAQSQVRFGHRLRPEPVHQMPEVVRAAAVTAFAHHVIQAAGAQRRIACEGVLDERHERFDHRGPYQERRRDAGLREDAAHRVTVDSQLPAQRTDAPTLGVIQPQDLRLQVSWDHAGNRSARGSGLSAPRPAPRMRPRRQRRATQRARGNVGDRS